MKKVMRKIRAKLVVGVIKIVRFLFRVGLIDVTTAKRWSIKLTLFIAKKK